jgi:hypothetical protein
MARFVIVLLLLTVGGCSTQLQDLGSGVTVRVKIVEAPKPYQFSGCSCADNRHAKPYMAQVSVIKFVLPDELAGRKLKIYHYPTLEMGTLWEQVGAICEFHVPQKAIGKAYPEEHPNNTQLIPYSHYIMGKLREIR